MLELSAENKIAGVLAPSFAIRGAKDLGIGDTEALKELISWAARQGLSVVQILPINETGGDCSPYNLLSAMALEPMTIATFPGILPDLTKEDFDRITVRYDLTALRQGPVRYWEVRKLKRQLLYAAFRTFRSRGAEKARAKAFAEFEKNNADWLPNYATHRALVSWHEESENSDRWPRENRSPTAVRVWIESLTPSSKRHIRDLVRFHAYVQWIAYAQWLNVREHAEREGVALMGDVPVGVCRHSADVWANPDIFDLKRSIGAPPEKAFKADPFTARWGQNWGFPIYNWERMAQDNFAWWRRRLRLLMGIFHLLRVDHALGFFRIYSFPWQPWDNAKFTDLTPEAVMEITGGELPHFVDRDDATEENREYNRQHGEKILKMMLEEIGPHRLIAEDLGEVAPYVRPALQHLEIPGFKIPQWERDWDRLIPGEEYQRLSLATFATHDHPPVKSHWDELFLVAQSEDKRLRDTAIHGMWELMNFCGQPDIKLPQPFSAEIHEILLHGLFASNSWIAVHMIVDLFGTDERFNVPGSSGDANWTHRMSLPIQEWDAAYSSPLALVRRSLFETGRSRK
ncbi:MAG TPA: 4-alpha-glucanotransferase [Terrimicrobiaceae bacterium]